MSLLQKLIHYPKIDKVKSYIPYAIGEIILVVIGIILAVQINEWRESVKNERTLIEHYKNINLNIRADILDLERVLTSSELAISSADSLLRQFQTIQEISNITKRNIGRLLLEYTFNPIKTGIEGLNNSGLTGLIDPELNRQLLKYYWLCEKIAHREGINNLYIQQKYEGYLLDNYPEVFQGMRFNSFIKPYYKNDPRTLSPIDRDAFLKDQKLEALVLARLFQSITVNRLYKEAISQAKTMELEIQADIK
jgi:hypothetical protein